MPSSNTKLAMLVASSFLGCASPLPHADGGIDGASTAPECDWADVRRSRWVTLPQPLEDYGWYFAEYALDGVEGRTACTVALSGAYHSVSRDILTYAFGYGGDDLPLPLPGQLCGGTFDLSNTALVTGASGPLEHVESYPFPVEARPVVTLRISYRDDAVEDGPCIAEVHGHVTGGTWQVLTGGSAPGDWVDLEARGVTFEPIVGHELRFSRIRWHMRLEPVTPQP